MYAAISARDCGASPHSVAMRCRSRPEYGDSPIPRCEVSMTASMAMSRVGSVRPRVTA